MTPSPDTNPLRRLPAINTLLESETARQMMADFGHAPVRDALRTEMASVRQALINNAAGVPTFTPEAFYTLVRRRLDSARRARLQRVINGTGIVIHTNMGRAPLASAAVEAVCEVARGYSSLELDLETGKRGVRGGQAVPRLCRLTGAASAAVVNNNAAAVLLALSAVAAGGEVIISRGELVEIGGAFRIPDVIRQSGARLVEVGTTNKTRLSDYAEAITPETKVLLKVHASNYRIIGFHSEVAAGNLVTLGHEYGLLVMEDLGSGALVDLTRYGLPHEPTVSEAIQAGVDVVAFSGDKLLGGPQCGLLVGQTEAIDRMARHPLFRAVRADKMTLAALEATLSLYEEPDTLLDALPVLRMLSQPAAQLLSRARRLRTGLKRLPGIEVRIVDGVGFSGGGTLPEHALPSKHVQVRSHSFSADCLSETLRHGRPAVIGMVAGDAFTLDVRTLADAEVSEVIQAFRSALGGEASPPPPAP